MNLENVCRKKFNELYRERQQVIINGVPEWSEYRYQIGYLRGMFDLYAELERYLKNPDDIEDAEEGR